MFSSILRAGVFIVLWALSAETALAQDELELRVKAAFLFNFAKFATWPQSKVRADNSTIHLCVEGDDHFAGVLRDLVHGRTVDAHPVDVLASPKGAQLASCHLVYVSLAEDGRIAGELASSAQDAALTVHELPETASEGAIRFFINEGRVRFEVNVAAASRAGVSLSSKLLEVAEVVSR